MVAKLNNPPKKVPRGLRVKNLARQNAWWLQWAQEDLNRALDGLDYGNPEYYHGRIEALQDVQWYLETAPDRSMFLHTSKIFALVPAAVAVTYVITNHRKDKQPDA